MIQIDRLLSITYALLNNKVVTAKEFADRFNVSTRTIYRDIETLSMSGIPVYMNKGKGGGISLLDDFVINKTLLNEQERSDVIASLQAFDTVSFNNQKSALEKLDTLFGSNTSSWIEIDFSPWHNADKEKELFDTIKSAVLSRSLLSFNYSNADGETTKDRVVEPYKIFYKGISRYLYAYCRLRSEFRYFKLSRMKNVAMLDDKFECREIPEKQDVKNIFEDKYIKLKLRLSPKMAFRVYDEFEEYYEDDDGYFIATKMYPVGAWLFQYVASFMSECEVLEPESVREDIVKEFQTILNNYL